MACSYLSLAALKIAPQPPLLKAYLCPIDEPRRSPRPGLGDTERRPAGWINCAVCSGAARAVCEQSYGMQPEIDGPTFTRNLDCKIMREHVRFLVRDASGFGRRHVGAVADRIDVVPLGSERVVIHSDAGFRVRQSAVEKNLSRPVRRHHHQQVIPEFIVVKP